MCGVQTGSHRTGELGVPAHHPPSLGAGAARHGEQDLAQVEAQCPFTACSVLVGAQAGHSTCHSSRERYWCSTGRELVLKKALSPLVHCCDLCCRDCGFGAASGGAQDLQESRNLPSRNTVWGMLLDSPCPWFAGGGSCWPGIRAVLRLGG